MPEFPLQRVQRVVGGDVRGLLNKVGHHPIHRHYGDAADGGRGHSTPPPPPPPPPPAAMALDGAPRPY